ncbi:hypothetical protein PMI06_007626 [Burkholderia sp. BT03]|nr:hypothetical protein [Paraburkholderia hospita]EUC13678.1 hypothetical protein PMI06_007626 [Burkholderia sp. BT03]SKC92768.1 hypothetical protein SAMN06266956_5246 [Paraburkholderia hospita]
MIDNPSGAIQNVARVLQHRLSRGGWQVDFHRHALDHVFAVLERVPARHALLQVAQLFGTARAVRVTNEFARFAQRIGEFLADRIHLALGPDERVDHSRHDDANQDADRAVANLAQVGRRTEAVFQRGHREGEHELRTDIGRALGARGHPGTREEYRGEHQQKAKDAVEAGDDDDGREQSEQRADQRTATAQHHFLERRARAGIRDDHAGQQAGMDAVPLRAVIEHVADQCGQRHLEREAQIHGVRQRVGDEHCVLWSLRRRLSEVETRQILQGMAQTVQTERRGGCAFSMGRYPCAAIRLGPLDRRVQRRHFVPQPAHKRTSGIAHRERACGECDRLRAQVADGGDACFPVRRDRAIAGVVRRGEGVQPLQRQCVFFDACGRRCRRCVR